MTVPAKIIYLTRHGETEYNRLGIVQGSSVDADLNENGKAQAQAFFEKYKNETFDKIYTSKLKRTTQSVQGFIQLGIPHESYSGLNEISWGEQDGKASNKEMKEYFKYMTNEWASGNLDLRIGTGESPNEVMQRQLPVMMEILSRHDEHKILICMHGRAMRILLCHLQGLSLKHMDTFEHANMCLYELEYLDGRIRILRANDVDHLKALV